MFKKSLAVMCALVLCLCAVSAFATSVETGENVSTSKGTVSVYGQPQYVELKPGQRMLGASLGDELTSAVNSILSSLIGNSSVAAWEFTGMDPNAYSVIANLPASERGIAVSYLMGFYADQEELPADVAAVVAKLDGLKVANVASTSITYEGKASELRTLTAKVTDKSGVAKYNRFNFVRVVGETEWTLASASESVQ